MFRIWVLLTVLVLGACKATVPFAANPPAVAAPGCDDVDAHAAKLAREAEEPTGGGRALLETQGEMRQACIENRWSQTDIDCYLAASTQERAVECVLASVGVASSEPPPPPPPEPPPAPPQPPEPAPLPKAQRKPFDLETARKEREERDRREREAAKERTSTLEEAEKAVERANRGLEEKLERVNRALEEKQRRDEEEASRARAAVRPEKEKPQDPKRRYKSTRLLRASIAIPENWYSRAPEATLGGSADCWINVQSSATLCLEVGSIKRRTPEAMIAEFLRPLARTVRSRNSTSMHPDMFTVGFSLESEPGLDVSLIMQVQLVGDEYVMITGGYNAHDVAMSDLVEARAHDVRIEARPQ